MHRLDIVIRPARPEDATRVHEIHTASVRALCATHYSTDVIEGWLLNRTPGGYLGPIKRGDIFVAEHNNRVVGFGEAAAGVVVAVYVDPAFVLQGVGIAILRHALDLARKEHAGPVRLEATLNARDFYKRAGFREVRLSTVIRNGIEVPVVVMEHDGR